MRAKYIIAFILLASLFFCLGCDVPSKRVKVYFLKDGKPSAVGRTIPTIEQPIMIAITELMKGPNGIEQMDAYSTEIPFGTQARRVERQGRTAIIDFNRRMLSYEGNKEGAERLISQIVYTATSLKRVKYVLIKVQGADYFEIGKDDYVVDHPLERSDFSF